MDAKPTLYRRTTHVDFQGGPLDGMNCSVAGVGDPEQLPPCLVIPVSQWLLKAFGSDESPDTQATRITSQAIYGLISTDQGGRYLFCGSADPLARIE